MSDRPYRNLGPSGTCGDRPGDTKTLRFCRVFVEWAVLGSKQPANRHFPGPEDSTGDSTGRARRPELLARLVDVSAVEGESLDEIRSAVREQVDEALEDALELLGEPPATGVLSPGVRDRRRRERPKDPDAWLRKAARG